MKLTNQEKQVAHIISLPIAFILLIIFGIARGLFKVLFKTKRWLYKISVGSFIIYSAYTTLLTPVFAPRPSYALTGVQLTSQGEQIKDYIKQVFGKESANAFKILACENHSLNPLAQGHNANGTVDTGIFQVNSIWANPDVLKDWKTNIDMAHVIYLRGGWNEWSCESVWHALERNDTI